MNVQCALARLPADADHEPDEVVAMLRVKHLTAAYRRKWGGTQPIGARLGRLL